MRFATAQRPVEQFDTQLKLPDYTLEPDDEANLGNNPENYYYVDEKGNLIDPNRPPGEAPDAPPGRPEDNGQPPAGDGQPPAADDGFLDQATGRQVPPRGGRGQGY
jgi:penicillin-binding protein 1A